MEFQDKTVLITGSATGISTVASSPDTSANGVSGFISSFHPAPGASVNPLRAAELPSA